MEIRKLVAYAIVAMATMNAIAYDFTNAPTTQSIINQQVPPSTVSGTQAQVTQAPPSTTSEVQQAVTQAPPSTTAVSQQVQQVPPSTVSDAQQRAQTFRQNVSQTSRTGRFGFF